MAILKVQVPKEMPLHEFVGALKFLRERFDTVPSEAIRGEGPMAFWFPPHSFNGVRTRMEQMGWEVSSKFHWEQNRRGGRAIFLLCFFY